MPETKKVEIAMLLHQDVTGGHYGIMASPKYVGEDGGLRNGVSMLVNGWDIEDLEIRAWHSQEFPALNFGWMYDTLCYRGVYSLNQEQAKTKLQTLSRLHRAVKDKVTETFGDYVALVAKRMGVKRFFICTKTGGFLQTSEYQELTLEEAKVWLNSKGEVVPQPKKVV